MVAGRHGLRPDFADDERFTTAWWAEDNEFSMPEHQRRKYMRNGQEVARILLSLRFPSHSPGPSASAVMIWNFEVREDLRCSETHVGTTIVNQLVGEYLDREIHIGPTPESEPFWARFGWPMCDCDRCESRDFIVRRPDSIGEGVPAAALLPGPVDQAGSKEPKRTLSPPPDSWGVCRKETDRDPPRRLARARWLWGGISRCVQ